MGFTKVIRVAVETKEFVTAITCDKCGKEADLSSRPESSRLDGSAPTGFHWIKLSGGYSSDFPEDGDTLDILTCDGCLKEWVTSFKTPPSKSSHIFPESIKVSFHGSSTRIMWLQYGMLEDHEIVTVADRDNTAPEIDDDRTRDFYSDRMAENIGDESLIQFYIAAPIRSTGKFAVVYRLINHDASEFHAMDIDDWFKQYKFLTVP